MSDPLAVNQAHIASDVDSSPLAQHHTLGLGNTQAAIGSHVHDGVSAFPISATDVLPPSPATMGDLAVVGVTGDRGYSRLPAGANGTYPIADAALTPGLRYVPLGGMLAPVRVVRDTNLSISTPGSPTVDGVAIAAGDRVLLIAQTTGAENGIYTYNGSGAAMIRAADALLTFNLPAMSMVGCSEGTAYADTQWKLVTNAPVGVGTTQVWGLVSYLAHATDLTSSTTSSTTYADLAAGAGPTVSNVWMYAGQVASIHIQSRMSISAGGAGHSARMSFAVSGADTVAAVDDDCAETLDTVSQNQTSMRPYVAATTGLHTIAHKYRSTNGADTATFTRRGIMVRL